MSFSDDVSARSVNNIGVERVRRDIAVLDDTHRMPIAKSDFAVVAAAGDADRTAFLLT